MKRTLFVLMIVASVTTLIGCEQAQQALDTVDKAKAFKDDIEKKARDAADKAKGFMPGENGKDPTDKAKGSRDQGKEEDGENRDD
jgi:hypothetical protein